jgi:omega-hydroxy-beta-dihydromenaquinone-9 sulfotransferase
MDWRMAFMSRFGPGLLGGIRLGDWMKLLLRERSAVEWRFLPRLLAITSQAAKNSAWHRLECRRFNSVLESVSVPPPIFILGHWRSGTTLLHNLLAQDHRFATPNSYQTSFPHIFLSAERFEAPMLRGWIPRTRPMDDMKLSLSLPQEDEFALCASTQMSPCMAWVFPRQREKFERYLTMSAVSDQELRVWEQAFLLLVKKLYWLYQRRLVLKSPPHTARVRRLLNLFPGAKFVHIHRQPYHIFRSSLHLFRIMFRWHGLQRPSLGDLDDWILRQGEQMYEAFFDARPVIPRGAYHEMGFEDLERDPVGELAKLYRALDLPDFPAVQPEINRYVDSLQGYRKNALPDLAPVVREQVAGRWKGWFREWDYAV